MFVCKWLFVAQELLLDSRSPQKPLTKYGLLKEHRRLKYMEVKVQGEGDEASLFTGKVLCQSSRAKASLTIKVISYVKKN